MDNTIDLVDRLLTLKQAAELTGLPYFKIQRAVKNGMLPSYKLFNNRKYVKLRDIHEVMNAAS